MGRAHEFLCEVECILAGDLTEEEREVERCFWVEREYTARKRPHIALGTQGHRLRTKEARRA